MFRLLPTIPSIVKKRFIKAYPTPSEKLSRFESVWSIVTCSLALTCLLLIIFAGSRPVQQILSPLVTSLQSLNPFRGEENSHEVFGFAPYWTLNKLDDVDFNTLTTLAYFGIPIQADGTLDREDLGYKRFHSQKATEVFSRAQASGTKIQLTVTMMDNDDIEEFLSNKAYWQRSIHETVSEIKSRELNGVNIDIEYVGNPGIELRNRFSEYVREMTEAVHSEIADARVSVSVYASSVKEPKLYDISALGRDADAIFMMAYDFAAARSDHAAPTAPLFGFKQGHYAYDVSTAVEDFLTVMPSEKLILGVPYYGYNYLVYTPEIKAETRPYSSWRGRPTAQVYSIGSDMVAEQSGWDDVGQVGWKAYYVPEDDTWRMIFLDDVRSLGMKYDYAKTKNLAGVGIWALGFDNGKKELWALLKEKFGTKLANGRLSMR